MQNPHGQRFTAFVANLIKGQPVPPGGSAELQAICDASKNWTPTPEEYRELASSCLAAAMERLAATIFERVAAEDGAQPPKRIPEA
jgi:hypothetical protein